MNNSANNASVETDTTSSPAVQYLFVMPECVNIGLLAFVIYRMYRGVAIQHPMYVVLLLNLVVTLLSSVVNIILFLSLDHLGPIR